MEEVVVCSPFQYEWIDLHGKDGYGETFLHADAVVQQGQRSLLHLVGVKLRQHLLYVDLKQRNMIKIE